MREVVLILTGTVKPNVEFVARADVDRRIEDYRKSISFYLEETPFPIVFAENSGFDPKSSEPFKSLSRNERFRWVSLKAHPDVTKGKGFQEFHMLDTLLDMDICGQYFVKITGRYLVKNIGSMTRRMNAPLHIDLHRKMRVAITGCFAGEIGFYQRHLKGLYAQADDRNNRYIEHVLYDKLSKTGIHDSVELLPENPLFEGFSGSHGHTMARNPYKMKIRSIERSINRSLGIKKFLIEY